MSADLYFTWDSSSSSFFCRQLLSAFAERNSTKTGHMLGNECDSKMHVRNMGYRPTNQKPKLHLFRRFCNLTATFTAYIFGTKQTKLIDNQVSALTTTWGLLHHLRISWILVQKRLKTRPAFLPILRKLCVFLHCWASHMHFRTELNQTLPHGRR